MLPLFWAEAMQKLMVKLDRDGGSSVGRDDIAGLVEFGKSPPLTLSSILPFPNPHSVSALTNVFHFVVYF